MRRGPIIAALLLPLAGCYVQPGSDYGYSYGGYQPPAYQAAPYGYQEPAYQAAPYGYQEPAYPGYDYNGGAPYMIYEGAQTPLIYFGGLWGYHDRYGHFQRAPEAVYRNLESRHPQGAGAHASGGQFVAPRVNGGQQSPPPAHQGWQGGGGGQPRVEHRQAPIAPAAVAPPTVAPPAPRAAAPGPAPRQEERRGGDRRCPNGQTHC